ncbi:MAG: GNAT family N-acetyltransferase [Dehalococcoidales bacterium]|jgi:ribosomal protein S18 acetylase RimI-like enzyme|nr:GNAT family N-acetyltransferase [Dehalococcoidales bacterium]MDX9986495.1 GNAT family N-acetyltransferase [Dehalococcoidales bacterium]NLE90213.1 GNAT family N-acetyltransferase [Dehalococcoidales bacterium]
MSIVIRQMSAQDKSEIVYLLETIPQFKPIEITIAKELVDEYLGKGTNSGYHILVAEENHVLVGYICYGPTPLTESTWDIYWEAVIPARQGFGIGSSLINEAETNIRLLGGKLALIETSSIPEYEKTRKFYSSHGYCQVSCIPDFYAPGDHRITYYKKL